MNGYKGQKRPSNKAYGQNLLVTIARPVEDEMPYAYRSSLHPFSQSQQVKEHGRSGHSMGQGHGQQQHGSRIHSKGSWHARGRPKVIDEESLFSVNIPPAQPFRRRAPRANSVPAKSHKSRTLLFRCFQISSLVIIGISIYALVENISYLIKTYEKEENAKQFPEVTREYSSETDYSQLRDQLQSWLLKEKSLPPSSQSVHSTKVPFTHETFSKFPDSKSTDESNLLRTNRQTQITSNQVLDINTLNFEINNSSMCRLSPKNNSSQIIPGDGVYFMIIVHSAPEHFEARQAIRSTWGSVKALKSFAIRLIFLLGKIGDSVEDADLIENSISRESELFGDIVTGTFVDSYRNLTYKHLLGYKWALEFCPGSAFILKADDDAFIDVFQLFDFISRTYGFQPSQGTLVCNVFPEGTKPVRNADTKGTKWVVTQDEYPHLTYPKYCGGLAYLATPSVLKRILHVSDKVRYFWIDDVFVTGILRELAEIEPFYLNLRYLYEARKYRKWLDSPANSSERDSRSSLFDSTSKIKKFPFMIAHVERGPSFSEEMNHLWRKTLKAWSEEQLQSHK